MSIEKMTDDVEIIQALSDNPNSEDGLTSEDLKKKFDEGSRRIKNYINETLVPAVNKKIDPNDLGEGLDMKNGNILNAGKVHIASKTGGAGVSLSAEQPNVMEFDGNATRSPVILRNVGDGVQDDDAVSLGQVRDEARAIASQIAFNPPKLSDVGTWLVWESKSGGYVDTGVSATEGIGQITPEGGMIFGGNEANEASAKGAVSIGPGSVVSGVAAFAAGTTTYRSGSEYVIDDTGKYYVVSENSPILKDCDVLNAGHIVVGPNGLGRNYAQTSDGGFVPKSDIRGNEAIGAGSMASGMGAHAFARASKSLGYRTQAGYPTDPKYLKECPELQVTDVRVFPDADDNIGSFFVDPGEAQRTVMEDLALNYIAKLHVQIQEYTNFSSDGAAVYLRFAFANDCCDLSTVDINLQQATAYPGSVDEVVQVPNTATKCSIYLVYTGANSASTEFFDLTLTKYPHDNVGQAAVALGADTSALGNHAIAGGWRAIARGYNSLALGSPESTADPATEASGYGAVAIGKAVTASGVRSFAFGENASATGHCAISMGKGLLDSNGKLTKANVASAECAVAIGLGCTAAAGCTFVYGRSNTATSAATNSFVGGSDSTASHVNAIAVGRYLKTGRGNQAVFGQYNAVDASALLVVGKGTSDSARSNAFAVTASGAIIVSEGCYGNKLPSTGVKGQIFFLKV